MPAEAIPAGSPFLEGQTVTIAGAALLQRVAGAVTKVGGNVLSSQVELQGMQAKDGYVNLIASCEVEQATLQQLLYDIEPGMPFLFIDQLVAQVPTSGTKGGRMRVLISVSGAVAGEVMKGHRAIAVASVAAGLLVLGAAHARAAVDGATPPRGLGAPVIDPIQSQIVTPSNELPPIGLGPVPIPTGPREPRGNPLWSVPLKNLNATRERPIFLPSRRAPAPAVAGAPPPVVMAPPPPAEPERPQLVLVGAVSGETEGIAVFIVETTRDIVRVRTGENHAGWVLRSVRGREATLEKDPETAILALPDPLAPPGAPGVPGPGGTSPEPEV